MHTALPLLTLLSLAAPAARAATPVVLLPATGANVSEAELAAATDVLRADLEETGAFAVTLGDTPGGNVPEPAPSQVAAAASARGAALAIAVRISHLGGAAAVRLAAYRPDGALAHADGLTSTTDDLDVVLRRLARGLAEAGRAAGNADVDTVTAREADQPRRRVATRGFGVRLGGAALVDRPGTSTQSSLTTVGVFWQYDGRSVLADVSLEGAGGSGDGLFAVGLGASLPLTSGNVTPYLGLGTSWLAIHVHDATGAGLAYRAAAGLVLNRLSTLQFRVEGGYQVAGFTVRAHAERRRPQGPFLWGAIVF